MGDGVVGGGGSLSSVASSFPDGISKVCTRLRALIQDKRHDIRAASFSALLSLAASFQPVRVGTLSIHREDEYELKRAKAVKRSGTGRWPRAGMGGEGQNPPVILARPSPVLNHPLSFTSQRT